MMTPKFNKNSIIEFSFNNDILKGEITDTGEYSEEFHDIVYSIKSNNTVYVNIPESYILMATTEFEDNEENDPEILGYDFQGWPIKKMNFRSILESLGATEKDGVLGFSVDDNILDIYPRTLEDDGMGYGVNEKYITSADKFTTEEQKNFINLFIDEKYE